MLLGVADSSNARRSPINPDEVSQEKGSDVERPKPLRIFRDKALKMYTTALLFISHPKYICVCVCVCV